ncbi:MAG: hypothetical protein WD314_13040 [Trueperaceae bacterium]
METLWLAAAFPAILAVLFLVLAVIAFARRRPLGGTVQVLVSALLLVTAGLLGVVAVGMNGYRALTSERTAAVVEIDQAGDQLFNARFSFPGGEQRTFELAGDQLYVDARVLKWHPRASLLGVQTGYRLDRVSGRYMQLDDEQTSPRTVFSLAEEPRVDLFSMAQRYEFLSRMVDAEYGSATFLNVRDGATYQIQVSNSGLLIRQLN